MKSLAVLLTAVLTMQARPVPPAATAAQQVQLFGEPTVVLDAEKAWLGADAFWPLAKNGGDPITQRYALRAIGRLEDPANVRGLLAIGQLAKGPVRAAADAIVQSLYKFDPSRDPGLIAAVYTWFLRLAFIPTQPDILPIPGPLGNVTYQTEDQFHAAERRLIKILEKLENEPQAVGVYGEAAVALESLVRLNPRFPQLDDATMERLPTMVAGVHGNDTVRVQTAAMRILVTRSVDGDTERLALKSPNRSVAGLAMQILLAGGGGLEEDERLAIIKEAVKDRSTVTLESLRAYVLFGAKSLGCQPIWDAIDSPNPAVMLEAIHALGEACKGDEELTRRIEEQVRIPSAVGRWQRETHLFVTLAKRSPERAEGLMPAFAGHAVFWVRLYAVHAAVAATDIARLEKLAYDENDNVREAALEPLLLLKKAPNDPVLIADLGRDDVQLLRSAATLTKRVPADKKLGAALVDALMRLTAGGKETSRDGRLALIDALRVHGQPGDVQKLKPLLRDIDPVVASAAVPLLGGLGMTDARAEPIPVRRSWPQHFIGSGKQCVNLAISAGQPLTLKMHPDGAPIAVDRFLTMALVDHYYDRLSFHRVVPGFVVQGGSPGANEYSGYREYWRDEVALPNVAGSVGLSIRGRNTGDAQFYINLVDNPRLDHGYTIFAHVVGAGVLDQIMEGDVIQSITSVQCPDER
jgi:cyclophilin family peptidyl-prolyl cis-trans isomerase